MSFSNLSPLRRDTVARLIARANLILGILCAATAASKAEDCSSGLSRFITLRAWVAPAACSGAWGSQVCNEALDAEASEITATTDAGIAAMNAFHTACLLRKRQVEAEKKQEDALARADRLAKKTANSLAQGAGIGTVLGKNVNDTDDAMKRVADVGAALADIHQSAFGQLDSTMREFTANGLGAAPNQTLRGEGRWTVVAHPPTNQQLGEKMRTLADMRDAHNQEALARARQLALDREKVAAEQAAAERAAAEQASAEKAAAQQAAAQQAEADADPEEQAKQRRRARNARISREINSEMVRDQILMMNGIVSGAGTTHHSKCDGSARSGSDCGSQ